MAKKKLDLANEVSLELAQKPAYDVEIIDKSDFELMTMQDYQREKDLLASRRMKVVTQLDGFKLEQALEITKVMKKTLQRLMGEGPYEGEELTAFDSNQLMQTYEKALKTLGTLVRLDTVDGSGKAARLALEVQFGNGTSVRTVVEG